MAQDPVTASTMLANLQRQTANRKNYTKDEKRMFRQASAANRQALDMLREQMAAAGAERQAVNQAIRAERQNFNTALDQYKAMAQAEAGTQRFSGFGEGQYYAPQFQATSPEAQAVAQRIQQGQQFLQQYQIPQFFKQGRTGVGFKAPQAYALSQALSDGQVTVDELTGQYGQYFKPKQAERVAGYVNTIQRYANDPSITAEDFANKLKPVKGMEGLYQTRLEGGKYKNLTGVFRDIGNGQYQMVGVAPTQTKKESGSFLGSVLRIGGALAAPFFPAAGAIASGIGTLASGGNLGQALLSGGLTYGGATLGPSITGGAIAPGVSSAIGGGVAALDPFQQVQAGGLPVLPAI